jgi:hypothetical protein
MSSRPPARAAQLNRGTLDRVETDLLIVLAATGVLVIAIIAWRLTRTRLYFPDGTVTPEPNKGWAIGRLLGGFQWIREVVFIPSQPLGIRRLLGGPLLVLLLVCLAAGAFFLAFLVLKDLPIPSLVWVWGFIATIFIASFLPSAWMIRRYSPSISTILQLMLAAAFSAVTFLVLLFAMLVFVMSTQSK